MSTSIPSTDRYVQVVTRDLMFRSKVESVLRQLGWEPIRGVAHVAVVELGDDAALERVRTLSASGATVIAFGPHVEAARLRAAREAGAFAVPNSRLEDTLHTVLGRTGG